MTDRLRQHAREMRKSPTRSEDRIWSWLRDRRFGDFKFRRQHPLHGFIADFYCAQLKLVIEVDGKHHETPWLDEYDSARTFALAKHGIDVLRIPNQLIIRDAVMAADMIRHAIRKRIESD